MAGLESRALRVFPDDDRPHDVRPLTAGAIGAMIAGLGQVRYDVEKSMIEGAKVMRLVTGAEQPPEGLKEPEEFVKFLADQWLRSFGSYVPVEGDG
jgi:hypothetical protein